MSTKSDAPQNAGRRSGRSRKGRGAGSQTENASGNSSDITQPTDSEPCASQASAATLGTVSAPDLLNHSIGGQPQHPSTPPRATPSNMASSRKRPGRDESTQTHSQPKGKSTNRAQSEHHPLPQKPAFSEARPSSALKQNAPMSPNIYNETPSKAYAGPTFHASPAASSLPLPKFFSKSVPNVDKTISLSDMMGQEKVTTEPASESEGSPFVEKAEPLLPRSAREESPLDIFFQADRRDKARIRSQTPEERRHGMTNGHTLNPDASPSRNPSEGRHHSRHPTDGSIGAPFPLEMEGSAPSDPKTLSFSDNPLSNRPSTKDPPAHRVTANKINEDRRQAQTHALKQMLFSPRFQQGALPLEQENLHPCDTCSLHSKSQNDQGSPSRKPLESSGLASDSSRAKRQAALMALAQKQLPNPNPYTSQRPPSSHLRKEVTVPKSPTHQQPDQISPSTPTPPSRSGKSSVPTSNLTAGSPLDALLKRRDGRSHDLRSATNSPGLDQSTKTIEDDLRRILKMDVLGEGNDQIV